VEFSREVVQGVEMTSLAIVEVVFSSDVASAVLLAKVEVVFSAAVVDTVLLIAVEVVFKSKDVDMALLIGVEVAIDSADDGTTSLANMKVTFGIKVGAAAISLAIVAVVFAVVSAIGVPDTVALNNDVMLASSFGAAVMLASSFGGADVASTIIGGGGGTITPVMLSKAFSGAAQPESRGKTAVKMFSWTPTALKGGGRIGIETSRAISIERETLASTKARGPRLRSSGGNSVVWLANGAPGCVALLLLPAPQFSGMLLDSLASRRGRFKDGVTSAFS